jgi:hypothetical protein
MLTRRLAHHLPLVIALIRSMSVSDRAILAAAVALFAVCLAAIVAGEATYGVPLIGLMIVGPLAARWLGEHIFPGIVIPAVLLLIALVWTAKWAWTHLRW